MVGHGIGHQGNPHLLGDLLHDSSLAYAWRPQKKNRALPYHRHLILSRLIFFQIKFYRIFDIFPGLFNVHVSLPVKSALQVSASNTTFILQAGTGARFSSSSKKAKMT